MGQTGRRSLIVVTSRRGLPGPAELERLAARDELPRKDYVELARALDADILDADHMERRASPAARAIGKRSGLAAGQIAEALIRGGRYRHVIAWADRLGLPLATAHKLARLRRDLLMLSVWLSPPKKAVFLKHLKVHSHLRAIVSYGSVQMEHAAVELGVPREKLLLALQHVDDRFWRPSPAPAKHLIAAAGSEGRGDLKSIGKTVKELALQRSPGCNPWETPPALGVAPLVALLQRSPGCNPWETGSDEDVPLVVELRNGGPDVNYLMRS